MRVLLLLFLIVPLVEMLLLFEVAANIGGLWTVGLVVLTAVVGIQILKRQGLRTLLRARERIESGELPAREIIEGMLLAAAGALLLTPGFLTDALGFVLLTPRLRGPVAAWVVGRGIWAVRIDPRAGFGTGFKPGSGGNVYEGEYSRENPENSRLDDSTKP
ncbi:MAG: FxsA family protein [Gammaproteobacteria bacterium]|nr:FxsA family protein [Gammaproteobacteria bacterium]